MIFFLVHFFRWLGFKVPAVFTYYSTRMILASITALVISIFLGPYFIKKLYELKIGQPIRTEDCPLLGQLHQKKKDTPTMGGILILFSMTVALLLWMDLSHVFTLILFFTTISLGFIGGYDDFLKLKYKNPNGMSAKRKMGFQLLIGGLIAGYMLYPHAVDSVEGINTWFSAPSIKENGSTESYAIPLQEYAARLYMPFFKDPVIQFGGIGLLIAALFIMFTIAGASNAVNLTDGLDGLAAGCLIIVASSLALFAFVSNHIELAKYLNIIYVEGSGEIAIYLSAFVGACLGFLWYNSHPAQVFMGDTGSLTLGGIIGVSAVLLKRELLLGLIGGIFVAEALSVILQVASYRYRNKKRIFLIAPLHHHFEYKGWPETKVVIRFWIVGLLLAIIGIASLKFQ